MLARWMSRLRRAFHAIEKSHTRSPGSNKPSSNGVSFGPRTYSNIGSNPAKIYTCQGSRAGRVRRLLASSSSINISLTGSIFSLRFKIHDSAAA